MTTLEDAIRAGLGDVIRAGKEPTETLGDEMEKLRQENKQLSDKVEMLETGIREAQAQHDRDCKKIVERDRDIEKLERRLGMTRPFTQPWDGDLEG